MDDEFKPTGAAVEGSKQSAEKELSATEKVSEHLQKGETVLQIVPEMAGLAAEQKEQG